MKNTNVANSVNSEAYVACNIIGLAQSKSVISIKNPNHIHVIKINISSFSPLLIQPKSLLSPNSILPVIPLLLTPHLHLPLPPPSPFSTWNFLIRCSTLQQPNLKKKKYIYIYIYIYLSTLNQRLHSFTLANYYQQSQRLAHL